MNISNVIRRVFSDTSEQNRVRDYLDRSVSMADLERRQREIDNGLFRKGGTPF